MDILELGFFRIFLNQITLIRSEPSTCGTTVRLCPLGQGDSRCSMKMFFLQYRTTGITEAAIYKIVNRKISI